MIYHPIKNIILRFPYYAVSIIKKALEDRYYFEKIITSNEFREAIYFSTPTYYDELIKYLNGELNSKEKQKAQNTIFKYLSRMCTRCTPFASLASCATGVVSDVNNIILSKSTKKIFRLDMLYICNLIQRIQMQPEIKLKLRYKQNTTIYRIGNKYRYITYNYSRTGRTYKIVEISKTIILDYIINNTHHYITPCELKECLCNIFCIEIGEADKYICDLIDSQILISELDPYITGPDIFQHLIATIKDIDKKLFKNLSRINKNLIKLNSIDLFSEKKDLCNIIEEDIKKINVPYTKKYLLQVDSIRILNYSELSKMIIPQLEDCMKIMNKITSNNESWLLSDFKRRFVERYEEQEIPILEVLDPDIGIGYGLNQVKIYNPLIEDLSLPQKTTKGSYSLTPIYHILLKKIMKFNSSTDNYIEITDKDVDILNDNWSDLPTSIAAMFKIIDYESVTNKFKLANVQFLGCSSANLLARFAHCDNTINDLVNSITDEEQKQSPDDSIIVEISHIPDSRVGNILTRPFIRNVEIIYLTNSLRDDKSIIIPSDVFVSIKNGKIILRSKSLNKFLIPRLTTAHNFSNNPTPLYRFLCDLQSQSIRSSLYFSWGSLANEFEYFPRVIYKNIILSVAQWKLKKIDLYNQSKNIDISRIKIWKEKNHLPRYVNLIEGDNKLFVDLENENSVFAFLSELAHKEVFVLEEFIESSNFATDEDGNSYMNECIIPFIKSPKQ